MSFNTKSQSLPLTLQKFMYYDKFLSEKSEPLQSPLESRFLEEFIQIKLLSKGAFGHVYGAIKKMEDKKYAVKCIKLDKNHEKVAQDSTREVKVLSELKHRNIVFYYNAWLQEHPPPDWQDDGTDDENSDMSFDSKRFKEAEQRSEDASVTSRLDHLAMSSKKKSSSDSNSDVVFLAETNHQMSRQERLPLSSSRHAESSIQPSKNYTYLYIQMELCRKENLASWLKTRQPSQLNVDQIYREILSAVKYLHSQNIVHRDLKPNNIFFDRDWSIKVGDFGLSKWMTTERESHSTGSAIKRKQPGMFDCRMKHTKYVGTKPYMAPEQENGHKYNHKVDVYALAIILFELKAGPFNTGTERAISIAELKSFRFPDNFDPDTKLLLYAMLSEDPVHRPEVSVILSKHFPKEVEPINPRPIKQRNALASARPPIRHAGDIFHSKLLMLFLIRGIRLGYQFQLGANMPGLGGIFDDLIFKYCANLSTGTNVSWRYRIVQVKYKQEEAFRITANELLSKNSGDFSLEKYFHSFVDIKKRGGDIQNYIISTNVGFDAIDLIKRGFQLVPVEPPDNILTFENPPEGQKSACYRLQITDQLREKCSMEWSDIYLLAITLLQYSQSYDFFALRFDVLRRYHVALVSERVIDSDTKKFHLDFVNNVNLLQDAQLLRFIICKLIRGEENLINWTFIIKTTFGKRRKNDVDFLPQLIAGKDIDEFFDKLIFAVDMPNIADLDHILTDEIGQHFKLLGPRMLQRVWELSHQKFLSSEDGLKIIEENKQAMALNDLNVISVDYRNRLCKNHRQDEPEDLEHFNRELMQFLYQSSNTNILTLRVITSRPKSTAVKVFSALVTLLDFRKDATYLTVSSKRLEDMDEMKQWKKALEEGPYQLLIVVCKDNVQFHEIYDKLILPEALTKEVIIICKNQESVELHNGQSNTLTTADGWMEIKDHQ